MLCRCVATMSDWSGGKRRFQMFDEIEFRLRVHRARRFVEEQHFRRTDEGTRENEKRALAAREAPSPLADRKVEARRIAREEDIGAGTNDGVDQLVVVGLGRAEHQIVTDRAAENIGVLADEAERFAQLVWVILPAVEPIDEHLAAGRRRRGRKGPGRASTCRKQPGR